MTAERQVPPAHRGPGWRQAASSPPFVKGMMMARNESRSGFTLIELMIVAIVVGVLAGVAIPRFSAVADQAKQWKRQAASSTCVAWRT